MSDNITWNAAAHPLKRVGIGDDGTVWVHASWHPCGAQECRNRAVLTNQRTFAQAGTLFVSAEFIESEYAREVAILVQQFKLEEATRIELKGRALMQAIAANIPGGET